MGLVLLLGPQDWASGAQEGEAGVEELDGCLCGLAVSLPGTLSQSNPLLATRTVPASACVRWPALGCGGLSWFLALLEDRARLVDPCAWPALWANGGDSSQGADTLKVDRGCERSLLHSPTGSQPPGLCA